MDGDIVDRTAVADGIVIGGVPTTIMVIEDGLINVFNGNLAAVILIKSFDVIYGRSSCTVVEAGILIFVVRQYATILKMR